MRRRKRQVPEMGMQMGPMIDMVFLLLVFFMVTAKPIKPESDVSLSLPGTVVQDEIVDLPNEQMIILKRNGQVFVNDLPMDRPGDASLSELTKLLVRFNESSRLANIRPLITVNAEDGAKHQRLIDIFNACARSGVTGVTLATENPEGEP